MKNVASIILKTRSINQDVSPIVKKMPLTSLISMGLMPTQSRVASFQVSFGIADKSSTLLQALNDELSWLCIAEKGIKRHWFSSPLDSTKGKDENILLIIGANFRTAIIYTVFSFK